MKESFEPIAPTKFILVLSTFNCGPNTFWVTVMLTGCPVAELWGVIVIVADLKAVVFASVLVTLILLLAFPLVSLNLSHVAVEGVMVAFQLTEDCSPNESTTLASPLKVRLVESTFMTTELVGV